jgi:hypothetical protein
MILFLFGKENQKKLHKKLLQKYQLRLQQKNLRKLR